MYRKSRSRSHASRKKWELAKSLPQKMRSLLLILGLFFILVALRLWQLTYLQHDEKIIEARRPQRRELLEPAIRGTIRDRFNLPLAINKIDYSVAIVYSELQQIPAYRYRKEADGRSTRVAYRQKYIRELSEKLGEIVADDADRIEDEIHSRAALYQSAPYIVKSGLNEKEYYRLRALQRKLLGLQILCQPKRYYPMGKVAGELIGHLGAIDRATFSQFLNELSTLRTFMQEYEANDTIPLPGEFTTIEGVQERLAELENRAYTINDQVGKVGVESYCEGILRGYVGRSCYATNAKGVELRKLPGGQRSIAGQRVMLTLSIELQKYCEELLLAHDAKRVARKGIKGSMEKSVPSAHQPWIKGGAIVVLDPMSGELLAMASYPRSDPNDFIFSGKASEIAEKKARALQYLEADFALAAIWEGRRPLERERYEAKADCVVDERRYLTWKEYLSAALPKDGQYLLIGERLKGIHDAISVQRAFIKLKQLSGVQGSSYPLMNLLYPAPIAVPFGPRLPFEEHEQLLSNIDAHRGEIEALLEKLKPYIADLSDNYIKVLMADIAMLAVDAERFSDELSMAIGEQSIENYKQFSDDMAFIKRACLTYARELYKKRVFAPWRTLHGKEYLKSARQIEKQNRRYAAPFIDIFDAKERSLFAEFWQKHHPLLLETFITGKQAVEPYDEPLIALQSGIIAERERVLDEERSTLLAAKLQRAQNALSSLPQNLRKEYIATCRSFDELTRPLFGKYRHLRFERGVQTEKELAKAFYPQYGYGFARSHAFRQATTQGSLFKLVTAYAGLAQQYRTLEGFGVIPTLSDHFDLINPLLMEDSVFTEKEVVYVGRKVNGKSIPQQYGGGRIPKSLVRNNGKLDIIKALVASSNSYFSLLAGDVLESGERLADAARQFGYGSLTGIALCNEIPGQVPSDLCSDKSALYSTAIGQHSLVVTPLQTALMLSAIANGGERLKPQIVALTLGRKPLPGFHVKSQSTELQELLDSIGIYFPLFAYGVEGESSSTFSRATREVTHTLFMPQPIRAILLESMRQVAEKNVLPALRAAKKLELPQQGLIGEIEADPLPLIGKTSTSEVAEQLHPLSNLPAELYNHIWFGGILFDKSTPSALAADTVGRPELVVVVYLRYGGYGKEAAALAALVAKKWQKIRSKAQAPATIAW